MVHQVTGATDPGPRPALSWIGSGDPAEAELQQLFEAALDQPVEERERLISSMPTEQLRSRMRSLLATHDALPSEATPRPFSSASCEDPASAPMVGRQLGDFIIEALIGTGGSSRVYSARQGRPQRRVALKVMAVGITSSRARHRFELESEILGRLRHPGIAQVYGGGVEMVGGSPLPWFAIELVEGARTIVDYAATGQLPLAERVALAAALCDIVQYGHQNGVLHRDLKPSNILIGPDDCIKVIDFGVSSCASGPLEPLTVATQVGDIVGTLAYMSPEQCGRDSQAVDARSDVYALGAVLYEVLTQRPALDLREKSLAAAVQAVVEGTPRLPSTVDPGLRGDLDAIVMKALELDPARRYQTPQAIAVDLRAHLTGFPVSARRQTPLYRAQRFTRRRWFPISAAAAVFLSLATATAMSVLALDREQRALALEQTRAAQLSEALARFEQEVRIRQAAANFLSRNVVGAIPARAGKPDATVRDSLLLAVSKIAEISKGDPRAEVELRKTSAAALQGLNELTAAAEQYGLVVALLDAHPGEELLAPDLRVGLLGSYGLVLGAIGDDRAPEIQRRAWDEGKAVLGESNQRSILAGTKYLAGSAKRDGFAAHRDEYEALYALSIEALGIDSSTTQVLRQSLSRNLAQLDRAGRHRAKELAALELASATRNNNKTMLENARSLDLEVLAAQGDSAALGLARELATEAEAIYGLNAVQTMLRRGLLVRALRHEGQWSEALEVAGRQAEASDTAQTSRAADRMDAWLDVAVAAAEVGDRAATEAALAKAAQWQSQVPTDSAADRVLVAQLDRIRAQALLDGPAAAVANFTALLAAREAAPTERPLSQAARREAAAMLARLAAMAGDDAAASAWRKTYLDECAALGVMPSR